MKTVKENKDENLHICLAVLFNHLNYRNIVMFYLDVLYSDKCSSDEFSCNNGQCVSLSAVCDGTNNCGDASDAQLPCGKLIMCYRPFTIYCKGSVNYRF